MCLPLGPAEKLTLDTVFSDSRRGLYLARLFSLFLPACLGPRFMAGGLPWHALIAVAPQLGQMACGVLLGISAGAAAAAQMRRHALWISRRFGDVSLWSRPTGFRDWLPESAPAAPRSRSRTPPARGPDPSPLRSPGAPRVSLCVTPPRRRRDSAALEVSPVTAAHWMDLGPRSPLHAGDSPYSIRCKSCSFLFSF